MAIRGHPSRGNASNFAFDVEAVLLQDARDVARRFVLLEAKFAEAENFVDHLLRERLQLVDLFDGLLLQCAECARLLT